MKILKKNILLIGKSLLLLLFISYFISISMFYHTHVVHGGMITHSHPFKHSEKKGPVNNHSHSTAEYILIQHFCETSITDSIFNIPIIPDQLNEFCILIITPYTHLFSANIISKESPRAPPVC